MNTLTRFTTNISDSVLTYLTEIVSTLKPREELIELDRILSLTSDLKAVEGIIQARKNELYGMIYESKASSPLKVVKHPQAAENSPFADIDWVCKYVHRSRSTIYRWVQKGEIPYTKKGKNLSFNKDLIEEWWNQFQVETKEERRQTTLRRLAS